ncbi:uncharacterized protein C5orf47 homolog [Dryobates pubescens]|uniref:uncharacterized protein C5orf47 homolog n=1 Tax=Dryobates pubescens TaxID=118200 RepID=UPI0023B92046|nr:uncharacterized protein C5orf47 homolog [Dryobates pubescens]
MRQEGCSVGPPTPRLPRGRGRWRSASPSTAARPPTPRAPASPQGLASTRPLLRPTTPQMAEAGKPPMQLVYVNCFGSHRCGPILRYSRGCRQAEVGQAKPTLSWPSPTGKARRQKKTTLVPRDVAIPATSGRAQEVGSCDLMRHVSSCHGDLREAKADTFDFPFPSRNVDKVIKRKKQKSKVWFKVWKVISKMTEENEKFRRRLLACSQLNGEGNGRNQSSQNEVSCLDRESSLFGWAARK